MHTLSPRFQEAIMTPVKELETQDDRAVVLGAWLTQQRLSRSYKRPELVKEALRHAPHARISQDYLAKLEYGHRSLIDASVDVREALRIGLGISPERWEEETGLGVPVRSPASLDSKRSTGLYYIPGYALGPAPTPALSAVTPIAVPTRRRPLVGIVAFLDVPILHFVDLRDKDVVPNERYIIYLAGEFLAARALENPDGRAFMVPDGFAQRTVETRNAHVIGHVISAEEAGLDAKLTTGLS